MKANTTSNANGPQTLANAVNSVLSNGNFEEVHPRQQHGKELKIIGAYTDKIKVYVGDQEIEAHMYKVVATWIKPKFPDKPTYAYPYGMIVNTLLKQGVNVQTPMQAIRIHVLSIYKKCRELIIYDNRPDNPYKILAWYQHGKWLPVVHPDAKRIADNK